MGHPAGPPGRGQTAASRCSRRSRSTGDDSRARRARPRALNHPHIVAVHDSGDHEGTPYIVMERLLGNGPSPTRSPAGPLPQAAGASRSSTMCLSALAAAHAAGILHRDIKPANILLTHVRAGPRSPTSASRRAPRHPHTMTGQIVGTMAYLSPDRIAGAPATRRRPVCGRCGRLRGPVRPKALPAGKPRGVGARDRGDDPTPLRVVRPDVDPAWRRRSSGRWRAIRNGGSAAPPRCGRHWRVGSPNLPHLVRRPRCCPRRCRSPRPCWCRHGFAAPGRGCCWALRPPLSRR